MDADDAMKILIGNLSIKEQFKLWRMLTSWVACLPDDILQDMKEREPELFEPSLPGKRVGLGSLGRRGINSS